MKSLLTSRKFWLTIFPMVAALAMRLRPGSTMSDAQLADALAVGFGALVLGIAHEDNGNAQANAAVIVAATQEAPK